MPGAGTTTERGYGAAHRSERARWAPVVASGIVDCAAKVCLMEDRRIKPGQAWQLDHTDDRTGYRGPAHAKCNMSAGGKRTPRKGLTRSRWRL